MRNAFTRIWLFFCLGLYCSTAFSNTASEALALQQTLRSMEDSLSRSPLKKPLAISSQESSEHLRGDLYASVEYKLAAMGDAAGSAERWCEIVLLLSNTKACRASNSPKANTLLVSVSSSKTADAADATTTEFHLDVRPPDSTYFEAGITATEGPTGTRDITLRLQAIPITATRSFVHLHYAYNTHWLGRMAMQAYLQTLGRGKLGFTLIADTDATTTTTTTTTTTSNYIGGARAVIERNTMRYFLGLECALAFAQQEAPQRFTAMTGCWYGQVEKYPLQLHEMLRSEYLSMKATQYQR
jgi:hypothetical protein